MWLIRRAEEMIPWRDFSISLIMGQDTERNTLSHVLAPWDPTQYITFIERYTFGVDNKSQLDDALNKVRERFGEEIPKLEIRTEPIALSPINKSSKQDIPFEEKLKDLRTRYWLQRPEEDAYASGTTTEQSYKAVNNQDGNENVGLTHR